MQALYQKSQILLEKHDADVEESEESGSQHKVNPLGEVVDLDTIDEEAIDEVEEENALLNFEIKRMPQDNLSISLQTSQQGLSEAHEDRGSADISVSHEDRGSANISISDMSAQEGQIQDNVQRLSIETKRSS